MTPSALESDFFSGKAIFKIAYITDLEKHPKGGGSYAVNWHIQEQLAKYFDVYAPGPVKPRVSGWERFASRIQRYVFRKPGRFFYFSSLMLDRNAERAQRYFEGDVDAVFFRSATRWCHSRPEVPYIVYLDVVFHTFFENTFRKDEFESSDLKRIFDCEANFLEKASIVFFESDWGLNKAREAYSLTGNHYCVAGRGGVLKPPDRDSRTPGKLYLLSVAMNFEQKGGDIVLQAFRELKKGYPDLAWYIVGGRPTGDWESVDGIVYQGILDPAKSPDRETFRELLAQAFLLVHPTREDTSPLVLTEAAYFGCPSVSVKRFAIPELVLDGITGVLIEAPVDPAKLVQVIENLIESPERYQAMRENAFAFARENFDWDRIGERMATKINACLK